MYPSHINISVLRPHGLFKSVRPLAVLYPKIPPRLGVGVSSEGFPCIGSPTPAYLPHALITEAIPDRHDKPSDHVLTVAACAP
jgi:hypothetical protein